MDVPSGAQTARRIAEGSLTSVGALEALLERIARRDPEVEAWSWFDPEAARAEARARDAAPGGGPLHGVAVAVKDLIDTAGVPTEYGSPIYAGHTPSQDADCVAALRAAGAVILGKTVTTEFACFEPSKTRNPHDPARSPAGSSSGSAAAVAAGMAPLALGTQSVGSIIRPASFCGVFGFKPSYGRLSVAGIKPLAPSFDTLGCFARDVGDLALWWRAMTGEAAPHRERPPRIALLRTAEWPRAGQETRDAVEGAVAILAGAGSQVIEPRFPALLDRAVETQNAIFLAEARDALAREWREHPELFSAVLAGVMRSAETAPPEAAAAAREDADAMREGFEALFETIDLAIAPAAPGEAVPIAGGTTGDPLFNRMATLLLCPSLSVPCARGPSGLPVGVQLLGLRGVDAAFLSAARWCADVLAPGGAAPV